MGIILIRKGYNSNTRRYQINKIEKPEKKGGTSRASAVLSMFSCDHSTYITDKKEKSYNKSVLFYFTFLMK